MKMKILCVCTSGKDRSPIMAEYLRERGHDSCARGINKFFTDRHGTYLIDHFDLYRADVVVVVSETHAAYVHGMLRGSRKNPPPVIVVPLKDRRHKDMPREEFVSLVRAAMEKKIGKIEG